MPAKKKGFNGLTPTEWTKESRNVWRDLSSTRNKHQLKHGAVFPEKLADKVIKIYTKKGDLVLDPFNGIGTTTVSSFKNNRKSIGIELNKKFIKVSNDWINEEKTYLHKVIMNQKSLMTIVGIYLNMLKKIQLNFHLLPLHMQILFKEA